MATPRGLVVPNIKRAQDLTVPEIAERIYVLKNLATSSQLKPEDLSGTTVTVSNVGLLGGTSASPVVNPPEIAICALGRMRRGVVLVEDSSNDVEVRHLLGITYVHSGA
jgi:2-oxoisovalerate dehydrogenase E2 component (dihydrolipoyl transacylase)